MSKGDVDVKADLSGLDKFFDELEEDVIESAQEASSTAVSEGLEAGKSHIKRNDRIWNRDVLNNWVPLREKTKYGVHVVGFKNYSDHAGAIDQGATWDDKKPHFSSIKTYVKSEYPGVAAKGEDDVNTVANHIMNHLYEHGMDGIYYSDVMEKKTRKTLDPVFKKNLRRKR